MNSRDINKPFDKQVERYQISWRGKNKLLEGKWGDYRGKPREHILPEDHWLQGVWQPICHALDQYVSVHEIQPSSQKNNLKSSWVQCINLFFAMRCNPDIRRLFMSFLTRQLGIKVTSIEALEFEYAAPGNLEPKRLLGEQGGSRGSGQTSPDIAVIFGCEDGKSGIYLIENIMYAFVVTLELLGFGLLAAEYKTPYHWNLNSVSGDMQRMAMYGRKRYYECPDDKS